MKNILCIQTNSATNLLLLTPLFRCLKNQSGADVHLLTDVAFKHLVENNVNVDHFYYLDNNPVAAEAAIRLHKFTYILDFQNDPISNKIASYLNAEHLYQETNFFKNLWASFKKEKVGIKNIFSLAQKIGILNDGRGVDFFIKEEEKISAHDLPTSHIAGHICLYLVPDLPAEWYMQICAQINHPIILLGNTDDKEKGQTISQTDEVKIYNAAGKFNFNEMADIMASSKIVMAEGNEYLLIAIAQQVKTVALWKPGQIKFDIGDCYSRTYLAAQQQAPFVEDTKSLKDKKLQGVATAIKRLQYN